MPKKWHQTKYSKPPSTAPAALAIRESPAQDERPVTVQSLLAELRRRQGPATAEDPDSAARAGGPGVLSSTVPPEISGVASLPRPAAGGGGDGAFQRRLQPAAANVPGAPRRVGDRRGLVDANGRRLPAGPAPPRSWVVPRVEDDGGGGGVLLGLSAEGRRRRREEAARATARWRRCLAEHPLDATQGQSRRPHPRSLVAAVLRRLAADWDAHHRELHGPYLFALPTALKGALLAHLALFRPGGAALRDLDLLLRPQLVEGEDEAAARQAMERANAEVTELDLGGALGGGGDGGDSMTVKALADFLFPPDPADASSNDPDESWDGGDASSAAIPRNPGLLPNLTHLSLALNPVPGKAPASWKQLLALAEKLGSLTHLSLAWWPAPTLTPNARHAVVVAAGAGSGGRPVAYGATTTYSHSLDDDYYEATALLRRLSRSLYRLECLDLTGCADWWPALVDAGEGQGPVDWTGSWGKVELLKLYAGRVHVPRDETDDSRDRKLDFVIQRAKRVESHIRSRRAGQGRWITVERDEQ